MDGADLLLWVAVVGLFIALLYFNHLWVTAGRESVKLFNDLDARIKRLNERFDSFERRFEQHQARVFPNG